jgi:general secretion pathway protein L
MIDRTIDNSALQNQLKVLKARYRASPLAAFFSWWGHELAGLIPPDWRRRMVAPVPRLWLLARDDSGALEIWRGGESPERLDEFQATESAALLKERWQNHLNAFNEGKPEVTLLLPPGVVLETPVDLPMAVEANLDRAIAYQLDQLTPFREDQVWHDFRVLDRRADTGRLKIDLRLVPKSFLESLIDRVKAIGIDLHRVDAARLESQEHDAPAPQSFNLLPEEDRAVHVNRRARLNWGLGLAGIVLLALVMVQTLWLRERGNERLRAEVDALRAQSEQVMALQRELDDALAAANFLAEHRSQMPVVMNVLDEITRVLPNDMWLQQVQIRDGELVMIGMGNASQRLIELVNNSYMLSETEFRGTVSIDPNSGQERFNARATITPWGVQDAVAAGPEG